jgi:hypothetical protein
VRQHYSIAHMADGMVRVYSELTSPVGEASRESSSPSPTSSPVTAAEKSALIAPVSTSSVKGAGATFSAAGRR